MISAYRWLTRINHVIVAISVLAAVAMMVQVSLDVICKYLFGFPIPLTLEAVSHFYMVALIFLPLGLVTRKRGHVGVELFTQRLSPTKRALFDAFGDLLGIAYLALLLWFTTAEAAHQTRIGETWETAFGYIEVWPARWLVPAGCVFMLLWLMLLSVDDLTFGITGRRLLPNANTDSSAEPDRPAAS
ncbi:TRAP transporter small permease subunit [Amorphus sp. 3PC139-8]|uniref:TRAP transporter small permease subunit n=1 Tax=Amorphus sp. 3PC139-8 TaxID=2735676 RepID=UPI00345CCF7B